MSGSPLTVEMIEQAAGRIAGRVHRTPVLRSRSLDEMTGTRLHLKAENLQRVGAFKARGAFNALLSMAERGSPGGVVAVSSGNHAQAVALAARELGVEAVIVMPHDANPTKVAATRSYGAEVVSEGVTDANRDEVLLAVAADQRLAIVHPYDDLDVMAGQGTVGLEIAEQAGDVDAIVVPVGGGGLISGVAVAVKGRLPGVRVIGVEPETADDARRSLESGRRVILSATPETIVDGVRSPSVGRLPWEVISRLVDDIVTVSDSQTLEAMELLWTRTKSVVEPAGAMPLAAVLARRVEARACALVLSGGNVDLDMWSATRTS